ncbi:MAG: hypothetical protein M1539_04575 [Actinobacteria bacterium]|nr:hypothetical protein [Actinomycetota bacterium]
MKPSGFRGACIGALIVVLVFSMTAAFLTIAAYIYGALLGIAPEFPFILTGPFIAGAGLVLAGSPFALRALNESEGISRMSLNARGVAGAAAGLSSMVLVWLLVAPAANIFDWPGMLYFMQLVMPGTAAGTALGIAGTIEAEAAARVAFTLAAAFLIMIALPFLPLWLAKKDFEAEAYREAGRYFQLPANLSFTMADEGPADGLLQANVRYRLTGSADDGGRSYSVNVLGERRRYSIGIREVYAYVRVPAADYAFAGDWGSLAENREAQKVALDLARSYCLVPLKITSIDDGTSAGAQSIKMQGDGLEVTVRPVGGRPPSLIDIAFTAPGKGFAASTE